MTRHYTLTKQESTVVYQIHRIRSVMGAVSLLCGFALFVGCGVETQAPIATPNNSTETANVTVLQDQVVEAACGECQFQMEGNSCDLAIRVNGKSYFVDGAKLDEQGDPHGADGMCTVKRQAKVSGRIENGRFAATSFDLLPIDETTQPAQAE
jgi:hypothetical protein